MQELAEFANNNPLLVTGLIASALAVIFNELRIKSRGVSALSTSMAVRLINAGGAVVDIRDAEKYSMGHIIDSHNIPEKQIAENSGVLDRFKKSIILVCDNGGRSSESATRLRKGGKENVFSLKGGLQTWRDENLPIDSKQS